VPGGRAQRLLTVLAAHYGRFVPAEVLTGAPWGERLPDRPERTLAALVSRLRRSPGPGRVEGGPSAYRLVDDEATTVDVSAALALIATAESELSRGLHGLAATSARSAEDLLTTGRPLAGEPDSGGPRRSGSRW